MLIQIPNSFEFMGVKWTILHEAPEDAKWACTRFGKQIIQIDPKVADDHREQTYIHELLHVLFYNMGIDKAVGLDESNEEIVVNALANGLYAMLKSGVISVQDSSASSENSDGAAPDS